MNLWIMRHAESANNRIAATTDYGTFVATRVADPPITPLGERQAEHLAEHLASSPLYEFGRGGAAHLPGYGITRLVCSPMLRTLQTAAPVARALGLPLEVWTDIHEHGGIFDGNPRLEPGAEGAMRSFPGMTRAQMQERFPGVVLPPSVTEEGWWRGGYEEYGECEERAGIVAEQIVALAAEQPELRLALVTHGTFMNDLLRALLGIPGEASMFFSHLNTGITRIEFAQDGFRVLRYQNRLTHLTPELLTR